MYAQPSEIPAGKNCVGGDLSDFEVIQVKRCRNAKKRRLVSGAALLLPNDIVTGTISLPKGTGDADYDILTRVSLRTSKDI